MGVALTAPKKRFTKSVIIFANNASHVARLCTDVLEPMAIQTHRLKVIRSCALGCGVV